MAVTVRLFAALRDAAGCSAVDVEPAPLPTIIAALCDRFDEPFATRVGVASGMLDGQRIALDTDVDVRDGAELALLPPFSGGSTATQRQVQVHRLLLLGSLLVPALLIVAGISARWAFGIVVVVIAAGCIVDLHTTLGTTSVRTMLPATLLIGAGPALLLLVTPSTAGQWISGLLAIGVMLMFVLAFSSSRRNEAAALLGATLLAGLLVGVGTTALLVLNDTEDPALLVGALVLIALTDVAVIAAGSPGTAGSPRRQLGAAVAAALVTAAVIGAFNGAALGGARLAGLTVVAVAAAVLSARLREILRPPPQPAEPADALLIGTADAVLIGAPLAMLWLLVLLRSPMFAP